MTVGGTPTSSADPTAVLNRLDWQLGEIGRRQHRFAWLRDPVTGDWIAVDAYYPGNRVVVIATDDPLLTRLCEDRVAGNELFLLTLTSQDLAGHSVELAKRLRARLQIGGWEPRAEASTTDRPPPRPQRSAPPAPDPAARRPRRVPNAPERAAGRPRPPAPLPEVELDDFGLPADARVQAPPVPGRSAPRGSPRTAAAGDRRRSRTTESQGIGVGITLVIVVSLELVVGGAVIGLDAGQYVLGFGFVLDACARVLGMVAAAQTGDVDAAWTSVLFGSPALWGLRDSEGSDLAPAARITAILAGGLAALGLVILVV